MSAEWEKMVRGELYDPNVADLIEKRRRARRLTQAFNATGVDAGKQRAELLRELLGRSGDRVEIEPPFYCDYGSNIAVGDRVFFNFNCVILDPAPVTIGSNVLFGPNVQVYTATHPVDWRVRAQWLEHAKPVEIGSDVWVGGGAIICPGVKIGSRSVIGAGSVVTRDIPEGMIAVGNPCKVIRSVEPG